MDIKILVHSKKYSWKKVIINLAKCSCKKKKMLVYRLLRSFVLPTRYYLRFKDSYRQATIDLMLGQLVSTEAMMLSSDRLDSSEGEEEEDSNELLEKEENLKMLIEDAKKMLIIEPEQCMGGWSLINADPQ